MQPHPPMRRRHSRAVYRRRRAAAGLGVVLLLAGVWVAWPQRSDPGGGGRPTLSSAAPTALPDGGTPIEHVVFIVKENRSFNNYFATYPGAEGATQGGTITCTEDGCEPGPVVPLTLAEDIQPHDLTHCFRCGLVAIDDGRMDGFNQMNGVIPTSDEKAPLYGHDLTGYRYFERSGIPNYWAYADRFVLADHFFTPMYGPTLPEHLYAVAAQSNYIVDNKSTVDHPGSYCDDDTEFATRFEPEEAVAEAERIMELEREINRNGSNSWDIADYWGKVRLCFDIPVLPDQLEEAGISWGYYAAENAWMNALQMIRHVRFGDMWRHVKDPSAFVPDVEAGKLPAVSWVIPPESYNEHPGGGKSVCAGENWSVHLINAIMRSPAWESTAIVLTWDDFGGFYDPVPPPQADVMGLGIRAPALIISPYTKAGDNPNGGSVDHTVYEFSSVLAFIEQVFGLDPMTDRDRNASPLAGAFDFENPNFEPLVLDLRDECPYGTSLAQFRPSWPYLRTIGDPGD